MIEDMDDGELDFPGFLGTFLITLSLRFLNFIYVCGHCCLYRYHDRKVSVYLSSWSSIQDLPYSCLCVMFFFVTKPETTMFCNRIADSSSPDDILKIFRLFDLNDSGSIRFADLQVPHEKF